MMMVVMVVVTTHSGYGNLWDCRCWSVWVWN